MRAEKELLLNEIQGQIEHYGSFLIMRYFGLTANAAAGLRNLVAKSGGNVEMVSKRLLVRAANDAGVTLDLKQLPGHIGIAFTGQDAIVTAKEVLKFSKESEKAVEIIGGRFDGRLYGAADVEALSALPGKDEMRAQLLGTLEAPLSQTLATMEALLTSVAYCLENKCKVSS